METHETHNMPVPTPLSPRRAIVHITRQVLLARALAVSAAMAQAIASENAAIARTYAFGQFARLVDVGGGCGGLLAAVLTAYPTVRRARPSHGGKGGKR